jgi:hypothetical protein
MKNKYFLLFSWRQFVLHFLSYSRLYSVRLLDPECDHPTDHTKSVQVLLLQNGVTKNRHYDLHILVTTPGLLQFEVR